VMMLRSASVRTTGVLTPRALKDFDKLFDSLDQGSRCKKLESPERRNEKLNLTDATAQSVTPR
jgi:hypothetical protein